MQISKDQILDFLRQQGDHKKAQQADAELPGQVDTERDQGLLQRFGVDPQALIAKFAGGGGLPGV